MRSASATEVALGFSMKVAIPAQTTRTIVVTSGLSKNITGRKNSITIRL
jgi:hypothetical protein